MSNIALHFTQVEKRYAGVAALSEFSLDVQRRQFGLVVAGDAEEKTGIWVMPVFVKAPLGVSVRNRKLSN